GASSDAPTTAEALRKFLRSVHMGRDCNRRRGMKPQICAARYWCSLTFYSHRGFSPVILRRCTNRNSRFQRLSHDLRKKTVETVLHIQQPAATTGLKPRCE